MSTNLAGLLSLLTPKRRWTQFNLTTMFFVVTSLCVWLSVQVNRANKQKEAMAAIQQVGGYAYFDYQVSFENVFALDDRQVKLPAFMPDAIPPSSQLRRLIGDKYFDRVTHVGLGKVKLDDSAFAMLRGLPHLRQLSAFSISDGALEALYGSRELTTLYLSHAGFGVRGAKVLASLSSLRHLYLYGTDIDDEVAMTLSGLRRLEWLELGRTQLGDKGMSHLAMLDRLEYLGVSGTRITDAGLSHVAKLVRLKSFSLRDVQVSDSGVSELQAALPKCEIMR
jgi:hypothetical protein